MVSFVISYKSAYMCSNFHLVKTTAIFSSQLQVHFYNIQKANKFVTDRLHHYGYTVLTSLYNDPYTHLVL